MPSDNLPERYLTNSDIDLMTRIAKAYAMSGLFEDIKGEIQAWIKVSAGRELGLMPFQAMNAIDIIKGKPVLNSNFLAQCVRSHERYDYRVQTLDNEQAVISFFEDGVEIGVSRFDQADAQAAGLAGGRGGMYEKYARNMLFARALSNGVAWFCPDVIGARAYLEGELDAPAERPEQVDGPSATMPPDETIVDVDPEPEMGTAVQGPMTGTASATINPGVTQQQAMLGTVSNSAAQREAHKAPEQVAHEADLLTRGAQAAAAVDAEYEAELGPEVVAEDRRPTVNITNTKTGETTTHTLNEPEFGADTPAPALLTDADKIALIGAMFRPGDANQLPTALRKQVKQACEYLECWGENTPTELYALLGDAALTHQGLESGLASAVQDEVARRESAAREEAVQVAQATNPTDPPEPLSPAEMLRRQEENVARVGAVLASLTDEQMGIVEQALEPGLTELGDIAKSLWISYGSSALDAEKLVAAVQSPPWAVGERTGPLS